MRKKKWAVLCPNCPEEKELKRERTKEREKGVTNRYLLLLVYAVFEKANFFLFTQPLTKQPSFHAALACFLMNSSLLVYCCLAASKVQ